MPITPYPWHQKHWDEILRRRAALPHALLFKGREGIGKLDFVRKLAQCLACETPQSDGAACGACRSCRWFAQNAHPDYREIQPEALRAPEEAMPGERKPSVQISIDDIRGLHDFINLTSHGKNSKTIVICPAEAMNGNAANALLKNLEEPPPSTRFMLVSHRSGYLPATLISRCQQIALPVPSASAAEQWMKDRGVADPALSLAQTGNAPLSALDLDKGDYWPQRKVLLAALAAPKVDALLLAEQVREFPGARLLGWLQRWTYDLLSTKCGGRISYNPDYASALERIAAPLSTIDIVRYHRALLEQQRTVQHPLNPRLFIEQLLLSYAALVRGESWTQNYAG